ncbi:MAG: DNA alkylation repair protein [Ferruginibacter sp.]
MTLNEIMSELKSLGNENIKKILLKHGVKEPFFGVKIENLKPIQKKIKKDYKLSNELYFTNNADAMYLAGLIADDEKMTKKDLQAWVKLAVSANINGFTVPWVTAGSKHGFELAMEWIDSKEEHIAVAGWSTLSGLVAIKPDSELDLNIIKSLIDRVVKNIHTSKNNERKTMNGFIIAVGTYVKALTKDSISAANKIGSISIDMNGTACKIPDAAEYIKKAADKKLIGNKKKTLKC